MNMASACFQSKIEPDPDGCPGTVIILIYAVNQHSITLTLPDFSLSRIIIARIMQYTALVCQINRSTPAMLASVSAVSATVLIPPGKQPSPNHHTCV